MPGIVGLDDAAIDAGCFEKADGAVTIVQATLNTGAIAGEAKLAEQRCVRFHAHAAPAIGLLEQARVAPAGAVRRTGIEKKACAKAAQNLQDEEILPLVGVISADQRRLVRENAADRQDVEFDGGNDVVG